MASFKSSFAAARKAGKKTFSWEGKKYTTETAEDAAKKSSAPSTSLKPRSKPATPREKADAGISSGREETRASSAGKPTGQASFTERLRMSSAERTREAAARQRARSSGTSDTPRARPRTVGGRRGANS